MFNELSGHEAEEALQNLAEARESIARESDPDAHTKRLLAREVSTSVQLDEQRGSLAFTFSEARVPTQEEIVFITREWYDIEPSIHAFLEPNSFIGEQDGPHSSKIFTRPNPGSASGFQWIVDAREQEFANFSEYQTFLLNTLELMLPNDASEAGNRIWFPLERYGLQRVEQIAANTLGNFYRAWTVGTKKGDARFEIALLSELTDDEHASLKDAISEFKLDEPTWARASTSSSTEATDSDSEATTQRTTEDLPELHPDRPIGSIEEDDLGRAAIAETIVKNVTHVWADQIEHSRPFAVHLSGRWGSGKSSILNFLREKLEQETTYSPVTAGTIGPNSQKGWVVVDYNAWQMQGTGPAWWTLRNAVVDAGKGALGREGRGFALRDRLWQIRQGWEPWLVVAAIILAILSASAWVFLESSDLTSRTIETKAVSTETLADGTTVTETDTTSSPMERPDTFLGATSPMSVLTAVATIVGALGAIATFVRGFLRTSNETAEAIQTLQTDPTEILKDRFTYIIKEEIKRPVAVFIDDLDRCDADFVVEVLQALQTVYADVPVLYVVAADREWIVSAYNQTYESFKAEISRPGTPLGYLFVKKIFQLSVNLPDLAKSDVDTLTRVLLNRPETEVPKEQKAAQRTELTRKISDAKGNLEILSALASEIRQSAVAKEVAPELLSAVISSKGQKAIRHALLDYLDYFDGNPRAIKRLINSLTFRQGYILMAGQEIKFDVVARWTILDMRYPYTAAVLAQNPEKILKENRKMGSSANPGPDAELFHDGVIDDILKGLRADDIEAVSKFG